MSSPKVLVTGASGYLAQTLIPVVAQRADVIGIARRVESISSEALPVSVDVEDPAAILAVVLSHSPDAIIHCAAVNPGGSDESMFAVNEMGTGHVAAAANKLGCRLVSVSSDTVLSGLDAPYADNAPSSPLPENAYAVSKARGEALIMSQVPGAAIVRTSLIYGTDKIDRGTQGFAKRLEAGDTLKLFNDVIRQPVESQSLSQCLCALALDHTDESGVLNIAGNEAMSRYTFGVRMLDFWGIDYADKLESVSGAGIAGLPIDVRLNMGRAAALGLPTPGVTEVLSQQ